MMFGGSGAAAVILAQQRQAQQEGGPGDGGGDRPGHGLGLIGFTVAMVIAMVLVVAMFWGFNAYLTAHDARAFRASVSGIIVTEPVLAVPVVQRRWCDKHGACTLLDDYATVDTAHYRLTNNLGALGCDAPYPGHDSATGPGAMEAFSARIGQPAGVSGYVVRADGPWDLLHRCDGRLVAGPDGRITVDGKVVVLLR